jgi:hypothetical protein
MQDLVQTFNKMKDLLFEIRNIATTTTKIDEAIAKGKSIPALDFDAHTLVSIGDILNKAFDRKKKIKYLNESISIRRQEVKTSIPQALRFIKFPQLSMSSSLLLRSHFVITRGI